jgi:hypothetical protein
MTADPPDFLIARRAERDFESSFAIVRGYRARPAALSIACGGGVPGMIRFGSVVLMASAASLLGALLCPAANAQTLTVEQYQHPKGEKDLTFNKTYLQGITDGLIAYNISVEDRLFCMGSTPTALGFERANDILMHWARKKNADVSGLSLGLGMLYGLKEAFPCKSAPR